MTQRFTSPYCKNAVIRVFAILALALSMALYSCGGSDNDEPTGPSSGGSSTIPTGTYSIAGKVTDESNHLVPDITVTLKYETGSKVLTRTTTTDAQGQYSFPDLGGGEYTVEASNDIYASVAPVKVKLSTAVKIADLKVKLSATAVSPHVIISADTLNLTTLDSETKIRLSLTNMDNVSASEDFSYEIMNQNGDVFLNDTITPTSGKLSKASPYVDIDVKSLDTSKFGLNTPRKYLLVVWDGGKDYYKYIILNYKYIAPITVELEHIDSDYPDLCRSIIDYGMYTNTKSFKVKSNSPKPQVIRVHYSRASDGPSYCQKLTVECNGESKEIRYGDFPYFNLPANGEATISLTIDRSKSAEFTGSVIDITDYTYRSNVIDAKWEEPPSNTLKFESDVLNFGSADVSKTIYLTNTGKKAVDWEIGDTPSWITSVSPSSGTLEAGKKVALTVTACRFGVTSDTQWDMSVTANGQKKYLKLKISPYSWSYPSSNIKSQSPEKIRFAVTGCRRECNSNTVYVYFTATNIGSDSYYVGMNLRYSNTNTRANDNLGNTYKCQYFEFGDKYQTAGTGQNATGPISITQLLAPGVMVKGVLRYDDVASNATSFSAINMAGENAVQGTITFLNVPIQR